MYIEFYKIKGCEYGRLRSSVRKGGKVTHEKSTSLGRVLDKPRLIFKNREHGVYQYVADTRERLSPPADFCVKVERSNARDRLIVDFGNVYFIDKFIEHRALWPVFDSVDYGYPDTFRALMNYYILEKGSNSHAEDWYEGSYANILYPNAMMNSARLSDMLRTVGNETVFRKFFIAYIAYLKAQTPDARKGSILIDSTGLPNDIRMPVTAISNHDGDIENEVRLIYVVQRGTGMPIYMRYIPGNIVDVSTLLTTIAELKAMKVDTKFAILDAGYLTLESMERLLEEKVSFLARVKRHWKFYKELLSEHLGSLERQENLQVFNGRFVYLKRIPHQLAGGRTVYCYLGLDDERRNNERRRLAKSAEEDELGAAALQEKMKTMGVFMLVSSRRIAVKDLLPLYYTRQDIEQVFDISKGYAKALPLCVQNIDTFRGHLLMVFCSTIVLRLLQQLLVPTKYSLDDFLYCMRNQKAKIFDEFVIPGEPTKKQREIYGLAGITPEISIIRGTSGDQSARSPKNNPET